MKNKKIIVVILVLISAITGGQVFAACTCQNLAAGTYCNPECDETGVICSIYICDNGSRHCTNINPCTQTQGCTETTPWTDVSGTNYQTREFCNSDTGLSTTQYRCQAGYYGAAVSMLVPTCTSCADTTGISSATSDAGARAITACYIPSGTTFSDTAGSGTYTDNCYYTE